VDDHCVARAEHGEGFGYEWDETRLVDAHDLAASAGGVEEWPQNMENRAHAEGLTDGHKCFHLRVMCGGEKKAEAMGAERVGCVGGGKMDGNSEGFEDVGRAASGSDGTVAVLGEHYWCPGGCSGRGCDERGSGGDVEAAAGVAAGAAGVDEMLLLYLAEREHVSCLAHGSCEACDLGSGLAAAGEGAEEGGDFDIAGLGGEDLLHKGRGVLARQGFALFDDAAKLVLD
jgi:hypothetical protein